MTVVLPIVYGLGCVAGMVAATVLLYGWFYFANRIENFTLNFVVTFLPLAVLAWVLLSLKFAGVME